MYRISQRSFRSCLPHLPCTLGLFLVLMRISFCGNELETNHHIEMWNSLWLNCRLVQVGSTLEHKFDTVTLTMCTLVSEGLLPKAFYLKVRENPCCLLFLFTSSLISQDNKTAVKLRSNQCALRRCWNWTETDIGHILENSAKTSSKLTG